MLSRALGLAAALAPSACLPLAIPPAQASLSGSPGDAGPSQAETRHEAEQDALGSEVVLRGALHPQQLFRSQLGRDVDVGAGYRVNLARETPSLHGPYAEVAVLPLHWRNQSTVTRVGVRNIAEVLYHPKSGETGFGGTLALSAEIVHFVSGAGADSGNGDVVAGATHGELGVGLFAGMTHRRLAGDHTTLLTAGISGRLPASVAVVCCAKGNW